MSDKASGRDGAGRAIVFVNRFYAPDHSATAQILTDLAEHLAARNWKVEVVTSRLIYGVAGASLPAREIVNGVAVTRVWTVSGIRFGLVGRMLAYLTFYVSAGWALAVGLKPGTIVVAKTDPPLIGLVALIASRLKGAILVNWVQDLYPEIAIEMGMRALRGPIGALLRGARDLTLRSAALTVAIGQRMAERIAARGIPPTRLAIVSNWSDDEAILPMVASSPVLRKEWGLPADAFVLAYSGNLGRAHEVDTLLGAAAALAHRTDIWFLFVGGGHAQMALRQQAAEAGHERFAFQPYQPRALLSDSLAVGDAHWLSLRPEFEGLIVPSKLFGIAAAARPIMAICDLAGEVPAMIAPFDAGIAIAPGDAIGMAAAIVALADDRAACRAMGDRARIMLDERFKRSFALEQWALHLESLRARD